MSTQAIVVVAVIVVLVLLVGWVLVRYFRRRHLRERFGAEYDQVVRERRDQGSAERELARREKRHQRLDIRPLSEGAREQYAREWAEVQARFVDQPGEASEEAGRLVDVVMAERGYPTDGYEQQVADLSVRHSATLRHYRRAYEVTHRSDDRPASTEELRQAMVHYRALFEELLGRQDGGGDGSRERTARHSRSTSQEV